MTTAAIVTTDRDTVLNAISEGRNTPREVADATGLNLSTVIREAEIMSGLYVTILPGPPCVSYWPKGKHPRGKLIREAGKLVELPVEKANKRHKEALIEAGNDELAKKAVRPTYDVSKFDLPAGGEVTREVPIELIIVHPLNVRGHIDTDDPKFIDLVNSVREVGIQQPVIITPHDDTELFRVVMGNRRRLAGEKANLKTIPCILRHFDSPETEIALMLIENIQRQGLKPMAEARAFKTLYLRSDKNLDAVARQTGCKQPYIYQALRLLKLDVHLQEMVDRGEISRASGAVISGLEPDQQVKIIPRVSNKKFQEVKELVTRMKNGNVKKTPVFQTPKALRETTDDERFTRSGAIRSLTNIGEAWFTATNVRNAFDDVCIDACLEHRDESLCNACPIPRFIESIVRRTQKGETNG